LLLSGRDRLDDANRIEPGALRDQHSIAARRGVEDEEADLVLGNMDRAFEADGRPLPRQLLCDRACPPLACDALPGFATGEIRLHEIARHAFDATAEAMPWKRQNV